MREGYIRDVYHVGFHSDVRSCADTSVEITLFLFYFTLFEGHLFPSISSLL